MVFFSTLFIYHKKNNNSYIILPSDIIKFIEFCFFFVFVVDEREDLVQTSVDPVPAALVSWVHVSFVYVD